MLALAQAEEIKGKLEKLYPQHTFILQTVDSRADKLPQTPLCRIGTEGVFVRELEEELLRGDIDMAVHSMKDLPSLQPAGLTLLVPKDREDPRDVLIMPVDSNLNGLREKAVIGTGSLRRKYQLLRLCPDLEVVDIRGNVETRIKKMEEGRLDGIVLAAAGIKRLGLDGRKIRYFSFDEMIPAPAQGALAVEFREDREDICSLLSRLTDEETDETIAAERNFLKLMNCGCRQPVGAIALKEEDLLHLKTFYCDEQGEYPQSVDVYGKDPYETAKMAAGQIRKC